MGDRGEIVYVKAIMLTILHAIALSQYHKGVQDYRLFTIAELG